MKTNNWKTTLMTLALGTLPLLAFGGDPSDPPPVVPEPSTIMASALLLIPLGVGAMRAWRKSHH